MLDVADLTPREVEQALDDARDARGLLGDDLRVLLDCLRIARLALDRPRPPGDHVLRRPDLVRDLGGQLTDRRELFRLAEPLLERELRFVLPLGLTARLAQRVRHLVEPR